jgi:hypothetical protein
MRDLHMLILEGKSVCSDQTCPCLKDRNMLAKVQMRRPNKRCSFCALFGHLFFRFLDWKCVEKVAAVRAGVGKMWFSKKFNRSRSDPLCQLFGFGRFSLFKVRNCVVKVMDS